MDILYDVDSVLRKFIPSVYITLKKHFPDKVPKIEPLIDKWDFSEFYPKFNKKELYHLIFKKYADEIYFDNAKPIQWAIDSIDKVRKILLKHEHIFIRTHQPENAIIPTIKWLNKYKISDKVDGVFYTDLEVDKNIIPNSILIDDKPENILRHGINTSVLIQRPWNKNFRLKTLGLRHAKNEQQLFDHVVNILNKHDLKNGV